jgi:hypothetical protein
MRLDEHLACAQGVSLTAESAFLALFFFVARTRFFYGKETYHDMTWQ